MDEVLIHEKITNFKGVAVGLRFKEYMVEECLGMRFLTELIGVLFWSIY